MEKVTYSAATHLKINVLRETKLQAPYPFFFINGQTNIVAYRPFEENYERRVSLTSTDRRIDQPSNERTGFIGKLHVSPSVQPIFRLTNFVGTGRIVADHNLSMAPLSN